MIVETFDKGMNLLEHGHRTDYAADVRLALWGWIKGRLPGLQDESYIAAMERLLDAQYPPGSKEIKAELLASSLAGPSPIIRCAQCKKSFPESLDDYDVGICPECRVENSRPENVSRRRARFQAMLANLEQNCRKYGGR